MLCLFHLQDGVLIYAKSQANDLFAIELYSGNIFIVVNLGTGTSRVWLLYLKD